MKTETKAKRAKAPAKKPPAKRPVGRPTSFDEDRAEELAVLCERGATDAEIAELFDVSTRTVYRWKLERPEFRQTLKVGKEYADDRVERSLYQKAIGYTFKEQQAIKVKIAPNEERIEVIEVERHVPPDPTSMIFWLKNRRSAAWRDKVENVHSNPDGSPIDFSLKVQFVNPSK